jgi:hypothetical protein
MRQALAVEQDRRLAIRNSLCSLQETMADRLIELIEKVTGETSFLRFLGALREECEDHEQNCPFGRRYRECATEGHWETHSTSSFLRAVEDWASNGDFAEGRHYGDPMLRRVATMLYVGGSSAWEDRP